jgi:hypothetical protein
MAENGPVEMKKTLGLTGLTMNVMMTGSNGMPASTDLSAQFDRSFSIDRAPLSFILSDTRLFSSSRKGAPTNEAY